MVRLHSLVASHQRSRFMPRLGRHWRLALGFRACSPCPTVLLVPHLHSRLCSTVLLVPHICPSVPHSRICPSVRFRSFPLICPSVRFVSRCTHTPSRISQTVHFPSRLLDDYGALFEKFGVVLLKAGLQLCTLPDVSVRTYLRTDKPGRTYLQPRAISSCKLREKQETRGLELREILADWRNFSWTQKSRSSR